MINIPVSIGDTILTGRFKNKKTKVTSITKDDYGMPLINGKKACTFRIGKNNKNEKKNMKKSELVQLIKEVIQESVILDKDEKELYQKVKNIPDNTLLSWAGYSSKKQFEDDTDEIYSKMALIQSNYEDIRDNLKELGK